MTSQPVAAYQATTLLVYSDAEALRALAQPAFSSAWRSLFEKCPWKTALQSPEFACTWYEHYGDLYYPLVLLRHGPGGEIDGLLTLAVERASGKLVFAGGNQAEYQVWLALPGEQTFIVECLERLTQLGFPSLSLTYLPPGTPLDWMKGDWGKRSALRAVQRPLLTVDNIEVVQESLGKKKNRRRLEKLQADGPMTFFELRTVADLDAYYDEIITFYDFRMGAVHGNSPFRDDPRKRLFYRALMAQGGLLHVTATKVGESLIAAHLGMRSKNEVILGIVSHSPFLAIHSPGKLHILQLGLLLHEEGFTSLDLTPGGDAYKEDRATRYDEAHSLTVFLDRKALLQHRVGASMRSLAKTGARVLGVDRKKALRWRSAARNPVGSFGSFVQEKLWSSTEFRCYRAGINSSAKLPELKVRRDHLSDLLRYQPGRDEALSKRNFLSAALAAIESGGHFYSIVENETLAAYASLMRADNALLSDVQRSCACPPKLAAIQDLYTHPASRRQDLLQQLLSGILSSLSALNGAEFVSIAVPADDRQASLVIEKQGFEYQGSARRSVRFGSRSLTFRNARSGLDTGRG
ncbi:MAG TPA: GNAT family N-acetyltransferase [Terriglobales bacterium]|nr:GNAT family N-acetyltransferase [Terriglobales bacterium]